MPLLHSISQFVKDPPPNYIFEFSAGGIAYAKPANGGTREIGFVPFEPETLAPSPIADNLLRTEAISSTLAGIAPANGGGKRRRAAVILPDYAARISVLDFDSFPSSASEQLSLIKFRLKKTLPFDIESAAVSYYVQPKKDNGKIDVIVVTVALEILARYEALLRAQNFHAGDITTAGLASLSLVQNEDAVIVAKLTGRALTLMVVAGGILKLYRCVELDSMSEDEIRQILYPTMAYVEDELRATARKLILTGLSIHGDLPMAIEPLTSRFGSPGSYNAGLLGYLEGAGN
jgi:type IV pilus assembly protein PilM